MAIGVIPVDATTSIIVIDLLTVLMEGVGPIRKSALTDTVEYLVERLLTDQEGVGTGRHELRHAGTRGQTRTRTHPVTRSTECSTRGQPLRSLATKRGLTTSLSRQWPPFPHPR